MALTAPVLLQIASSPAVRERFARGEALVLLDRALERVVWANAAGRALFALGADEERSPLGSAAKRQLAATRGFPLIGRDRAVALRLTGGMGSRVLGLQASALAVGDEELILLAATPKDAPPGAPLGGSEGVAAALVDEHGRVAASTEIWPELEEDEIRSIPMGSPGDSGDVAEAVISAGGKRFVASSVRLDESVGLVVLEERAEAEAPLPVGMVEEPEEPAVTVEPTREREAVRFTWRTDQEGRFTALSPEFGAALGFGSETVLGQGFGAVAERFGFDPDGAIAALLAGRSTWSGRTVEWPTADGRASVPVDLAALPVFGRSRAFEGFRGFGIARFNDAVEREEEAPAPAPVQAEAEDVPPQPEPPVVAAPLRPLAPHEAYAFREIGRRLRHEEDVPSLQGIDVPDEDEQASEDHPADDRSDRAEAVADAEEIRADGVEVVPSPPESPVAETEEVGEPVSVGEEAEADDEAEEPRVVPDTSILERLPVPLLIHAGDTLHFANPEFLHLTGYASLEALGEKGGIDALLSVPEDETASVTDRRMRLTKADGATLPVDALLRSVPWAGGTALMLVLRALEAATSQADAALLADLERRVTELGAILDTATDGVVLIAPDGTIRSLSRPAEALFGMDGAKASGRPFGSLFAVESQRAVVDYLAALADNGVRSVLNDGREVIGREAGGGMIPLFMTVGLLPEENGFCAVLRDITPWKRAEEQLTQSRAEAERASSHKTEFLARVSHEIRTPLNAIIGFSELMMGEKFGAIANDRYRDYLRDINRSGNHVLDLVNDLLDISKIEAGQQEMVYEAVALNETLAETVATMQPQANRERVIIRSSLSPRLPDVVADLRSVRQIALNILSNAVRYTQAGGQVIVSTAIEPSGDVALRVRDTGVGMTQGEIEQAMMPFRQINSLKRARGDGTGLGLPLTKAMVEANRANFSISSTPGEGTLVEIVFPATRVLAE